jgi:hypothetical protein
LEATTVRSSYQETSIEDNEKCGNQLELQMVNKSSYPKPSQYSHILRESTYLKTGEDHIFVSYQLVKLYKSSEIWKIMAEELENICERLSETVT